MNVFVLILVFVITVLVAGNNMIVSAGPLMGSRILKKKGAIIVGVIGGLTGFVVQGSHMQHVRSALYPSLSNSVLILGFELVIFVFLLSTILRYPVSLAIITTFSFLGASYALGSKIDTPFLELLIMFWVLSFFGSFGIVNLLKFENIHNIWRKIYIFKILTIILSFLAAFAWGSNTLGFLYALSGEQYYIPILIGMVMGSVLLGTATIKKVVDRSYLLKYSTALEAQVVQTSLVEIATLFSFPLSSTQALSYGLYSAGLKKGRFINTKPILVSLLFTAAFSIFSFIIFYLIIKLIM